METPDKILEQIRNLLNRTTANGCSENEAASAAFLVEKLLRKYNLSLADVKDSEPQNVVIWPSGITIEDGALADWVVSLQYAACLLCMVKGVTTNDGAKRGFAFIGSQTDCLSAEQLFVFFVQQAETASEKAFEQAIVPTASFTNGFTMFTVTTTSFGYGGFSMGSGGSVQNTPEAKAKFQGAFLIGYAHQLEQRVTRHMAERNREQESAGLVRFKTQEVEQFMEQQLPGVAEKPYQPEGRKPPDMSEMNAIQRGAMAAANVPIHADKALT
jgi:Protein of unknown function (DUF2786)